MARPSAAMRERVIMMPDDCEPQLINTEHRADCRHDKATTDREVIDVAFKRALDSTQIEHETYPWLVAQAYWTLSLLQARSLRTRYGACSND